MFFFSSSALRSIVIYSFIAYLPLRFEVSSLV